MVIKLFMYRELDIIIFLIFRVFKNSDIAATHRVLHVPIFDAVSINFQFHRDAVAWLIKKILN